MLYNHKKQIAIIAALILIIAIAFFAWSSMQTTDQNKTKPTAKSNDTLVTSSVQSDMRISSSGYTYKSTNFTKYFSDGWVVTQVQLQATSNANSIIRAVYLLQTTGNKSYDIILGLGDTIDVNSAKKYGAPSDVITEIDKIVTDQNKVPVVTSGPGD